ncbi:hypothetical protein OQZ33_12170 [Pedobacter sp. MC2016-05]|uniref:hypothetical protein n=1 Tax=Pedobacter sp. MC2016-05 TaxID=2994474 RepID=UPI002247C822|nr:hypothetical protein [Pedobacter sp. MC2016-05]MCX2475084.1 hypothetical protein [Pedobacter sp. MC2016-05]
MEYYDVNEAEKYIKKHYAMAKKTLADCGKPDATDKEIRDLLHFLKMMAEITVDQFLKDEALKDRLKEESKGFLTEKDYGLPCCICHASRLDFDRWYDSNGIKCINCQKAIESGLIPAIVATDSDTYYSDNDLATYFKLHGKLLTEWINAKLLKPRIIRNFKNNRHFRLFLLQDNFYFLPAKSYLHKAAEDSDLHWSLCVNAFEYLKDFEIINYLRPVSVPEEPPVLEEPQITEQLPEYCQPCSFPLGSSKVKKRKARRKSGG